MANEALLLIGHSDGAVAPDRDELNLRELWRAIMRSAFVLLATIIVITGATYAYISQQTPLYTIDQQGRITAALASLSNLAAGGGAFTNYVAAQNNATGPHTFAQSDSGSEKIFTGSMAAI